MATIEAFAAATAGAALEPFSYEASALAPDAVRVRVTCCGICHSDVHLIDNDWGMSQYPLVPGHEVVGVVEEAGHAAGHEVGDRVGIGWQCGSCGTCNHCSRGAENLCRANAATAIGHHGGFAGSLDVQGRLAVPIPDSLDAAATAPLLCGGVTVFSPLRRWTQPGDRILVRGIGGLGHMAVQFASAMGAHVTAWTTTMDKEQEARAMGAHEVTTDLNGRYDFILNTVPYDADWNAAVRSLRPDGTLCFVGVPPAPLTLSAGELLSGQRRITGSAIGGRSDLMDMLDFAALHDIGATIERMPMAEAQAGIERVRAGKARYRVVLDA